MTTTQSTEALVRVRELVHQALKDRVSPDLTEISQHVNAELSDEERVALFPYFLRRYVADVNRGFRNPNPPRMMAQEGTAPAGAGTHHEKAPSHARVFEVGGRQFVSARQATIHTWWRQRCDGIFPVNGTSKRLGDMTVEDLQWVAAARRDDAAKNIVTAERFERLAAELAASGVATCDELDEQAARRCWGEAA